MQNPVVQSIHQGQKDFTKNAGLLTGELMDKGGEVLSDVGLALAYPTGGASLSLAALSEGVSFSGKSLKSAIYFSSGDSENGTREVINIGVGLATNGLTRGAVRQSKKVGLIDNFSQELTQTTLLKGTGSVFQKSTTLKKK